MPAFNDNRFQTEEAWLKAEAGQSVSTPLPSNPWLGLARQPAASPLDDVPMPWCDHCQCYHHSTARCIDKPINTVEDYIREHDLHVIIAIDGFLALPIDAVAVEHDVETQLTYFTQHGSAIGTASWSTGGS